MSTKGLKSVQKVPSWRWKAMGKERGKIDETLPLSIVIRKKVGKLRQIPVCTILKIVLTWPRVSDRNSDFLQCLRFNNEVYLRNMLDFSTLDWNFRIYKNSDEFSLKWNKIFYFKIWPENEIIDIKKTWLFNSAGSLRQINGLHLSLSAISSHL